jgi:hypothetical protein
MSSDSLQEHRDRSILPDNRTIAVVAAVAVVVVAGAGVAMLLMSGDSGPDATTNAALDTVPQNVDGIVYLDKNATEDEMVTEMVDGGIQVGWWMADNGTAPTLDQILSDVNTTGLGFEGATAFYRSQRNPYVGVIVETGNTEQMTSIVESQVGNLTETTYNGMTVKEIEAEQAARQADLAGGDYELIDVVRQFAGDDTTLAMATLDDETVVLGSKAATEDTIDVHQGDADPLDPESGIHNAYERAYKNDKNGSVRATINTTPLNTPDLMNVLNKDLAAGVNLVEGSGSHVDFVTATYTVRNRSLGTIDFKVQVTMDGQSGAQDLMNMFKTRVENPDEVNNATPEKIIRVSATQRIKGSRSGRHVDLVVPEIPETVVGYVGNYVGQFGPDVQPYELVPQRAETWETVSIDHNSSALANLSDSIAFDSAVTFAAEDGDAATVIRLTEDARAPRKFATEQILDAADETTGVSYEYRENELGYRHSDAFVTNMTTEPPVVDALSGNATVVPEWFVFADTRTIVFGTEQAVKDAIDIYRGVAAPHPDARP